MPVPNVQAVLQRVADALHVTVATLSPEWASLAAQATKDAIADLTSILANVGYSQSQITQADQFSAWGERIAFVMTMQRGAVYASYDQQSLKAIDPREELRKMSTILIGGAPAAPDGTSALNPIFSGQVQGVTDFYHPPHRGHGSHDRRLFPW